MKTQLQTSTLIGRSLNFAIAQCEAIDIWWCEVEQAFIFHDREEDGERHYSPSTDWAQGGPIIQSKNITWDGQAATLCKFVDGKYPKWTEFGPNQLVGAMRCYIAATLGSTVSVPTIFVN